MGSFGAAAKRVAERPTIQPKIDARWPSQLPPDPAGERPRAAAAQRDGERDQAPQQPVFVAAVAPSEAVAPILDEREVAHLDRDRGSEEAGKQAERDGDAAD